MGKAKERSFQMALYWKYRSQFTFAAPNYTPRKWWECDMWALLRSGYTIEYEIKMSMSDLHADKNKQQSFYEPHYCTMRKHDMLSEGHQYAPNRFMFVVPESIAEKAKNAIPDWAELLVHHDRFRITKAKPAPLIHKNKEHQQTLEHCMTCLTNRYWPMLAQLNKQEQPNDSD